MIYLDSAATTRPDPQATARAGLFLRECYFNPSSLYQGGDWARAELKKLRESLISHAADPFDFDLIFTAGGSEADNMAVLGCGRRGNVVTTAGEHSAVYRTVQELKNRGVEPRIAPLRSDGCVDAEALLALVDDRTSLVSVIHVGNETGAVNPVQEIAKRVKEKNPRTVFHSDGVQAFGKIPVRLTKDIDLYSTSAHKIGGLKGTGALFRNKKLQTLPTFVYGGGQEGGLRSGTENTFGIACYAYAAEGQFSRFEELRKHVRSLRETLWNALNREIFTRISPEDGSPFILTVAAKGRRGAVMQQQLSQEGIYVGTGSACSSKRPFSRIIEACGYGEEVLHGVIRLSFSRETTEEEVLFCAAALNRAAEGQAIKG